MSYYNRSTNYPSRPRGGAGIATGGKPATVAVFINDQRMATMNSYNDRDGKRVATITLCVNQEMPIGAQAIGDTRAYGEVALRETMSVDDGIAAVQAWMSGKDLAGSGF